MERNVSSYEGALSEEVSILTSDVLGKVRDIMTREVITTREGECVAKAAKIMSQNKISCIVVMRDGEIIGMLTERDILNKILAMEKDPVKVMVDEIMTSPVISINPDYTIVGASKLMEENNIRRIPVVESDQLIGIITQSDISNAMSSIWKNVGSIMTRDVVTIKEDENVSNAAKIMSKRNISCLVVMNDGEVIGILTENDLMRKIIAEGKNPGDLLVRNIMTSPVIFVDPDYIVLKASRLMKKKGIRRIPIIKNGRLQGIVTQDDLVNAISTVIKIIPRSEETSETKLRYKLRKGNSYLILEENPVKSNEIFFDMVTHNTSGLYITRAPPQHIREKYGLEKTPILWLSQVKDYEDHIDPTDIVKLSFVIKEFIRKVVGSVVLIDGIEYLISQNSYEEILHFIQSLDDSIALSESYLILPIDPSTLNDKQLHMFKRELTVLEDI